MQCAPGVTLSTLQANERSTHLSETRNSLNVMEKVSFSPPDEPLPLLRHHFTSFDNTSTSFCGNICPYSSFLPMACVKANWVFPGPGSFSFNLTVTVFGRIYHYHGPTVSPANLSTFTTQTTLFKLMFVGPKYQIST